MGEFSPADIAVALMIVAVIGVGMIGLLRRTPAQEDAKAEALVELAEKIRQFDPPEDQEQIVKICAADIFRWVLTGDRSKNTKIKLHGYAARSLDDKHMRILLKQLQTIGRTQLRFDVTIERVPPDVFFHITWR